jgi:hypothetical protein
MCTKKKKFQISPIFLVKKWQNLLEKKNYIINLIWLIESTYSIVHKTTVFFPFFNENMNKEHFMIFGFLVEAYESKVCKELVENF